MNGVLQGAVWHVVLTCLIHAASPIPISVRNQMLKREFQHSFEELLDIKRGLSNDANEVKHVMVFFQCSSRESVCLNDGIGPALTYRLGGAPICTCLCPENHNSPRCEYPSDSIKMLTAKVIETD